MSSGRIHQFAIHPVRFRGIPADLALESGCCGDLFGELLDRDVGAVADVDDFWFAAILHEVVNGVCHIVDVEEFAERLARAPKNFFRTFFLRCLDETPDQGREDVTVDEVVSVVRAVEIAGHEADRVPAVLLAEVETEFVPGDLRQRVALIGGLQRTGQEVFLLDRLRRLAGIDAAGTEEAELFDLVQKTLHDHVVLDFEVFEQEFRTMHFVCHDPADFCAGEDHIVRLFCIKEIFDRLLVAEIKLGMRPFQDFRITFFFELSDTCAADHSAMAADENLGIFVNHVEKPQKPIS